MNMLNLWRLLDIHERTSVSVGGHDEHTESTTRTHTGLELSYCMLDSTNDAKTIRRMYKLAFFDKMDQVDSEFAQSCEEGLDPEFETSESGDANEKKDDENPKTANEASVVENEVVDSVQLGCFLGS